VPFGTIKSVVHLSQQTYLPYARLVHDHNEKGYGVIVGADGRDVYFSHETVAGHKGFDDLRRGSHVDYTLDPVADLRASSVRMLVS
jgi:cold shock CspA family protein